MKAELLLLGIALLTSIGHAEIINIPGEYESIQDGIDASEDGDTVLVQPGRYSENVIFNGKAITLASLFLTTGNESYIDSTRIYGNREPESTVRFVGNEGASSKLVGFNIRSGMGSLDYQGDRSGGGIICLNASPTLSHLDICRNHASFGGGIYIDGAAPILENLVIYENEASYGGGIDFWNVDIEIDRTLITGNIAGEGGGIRSFRSNLRLRNCTIYGNIYIGVELIPDDDNSPSITAINSIFWGNSNQWEISAPYCEVHSCAVEGGNDHVDGEIVNWENNIEQYPEFVNPENGDLRLLNNSPCIDAGRAFLVIEEDTLINLSEEEYSGDAPDIGAFEYDPQQTGEPWGNHPCTFVCDPPFPNPFNSLTNITCTLSAPSPVTIRIYNTSGQLVEVLLERVMPAGKHLVAWDGKGMLSGLYFCRLEDGNHVHNAKLVLVR